MVKRRLDHIFGECVHIKRHCPEMSTLPVKLPDVDDFLNPRTVFWDLTEANSDLYSLESQRGDCHQGRPFKVIFLVLSQLMSTTCHISCFTVAFDNWWVWQSNLGVPTVFHWVILCCHHLAHQPHVEGSRSHRAQLWKSVWFLLGSQEVIS